MLPDKENLPYLKKKRLIFLNQKFDYSVPSI